MKKLYTVLVLTLFVLPLVAQNIPSYVPKDGLVGYWPFNGNANDESGNGNHGTVNGATLTADRNGMANSAYSFDGVNDYVNANINSINKATVSLFYNSSYPISWYPQLCRIGNIEFICQAGNHPAYIKNNNVGHLGGYPDRINSLPCLPSFDNWHHIIFIHDKDLNKRQIWIDGVLCKEGNVSSFLSISTNIVYFGNTINGRSSDGTAGFKGQIDDIVIYNRALSEQEIKQLYEGCSKETATSSSFNELMYTTNAPINLTATPTGGSFSGNGVANNSFNPSKAKLGKNQVTYNFKNTTGCADSTDFTMLVVDTVGATCTKYDTVTITNNVTKYDTVIVKTNVFDTVKVTKYDTLKVTKFDTVTITNNVTKYDTVIVNKTKYDTVIVKTNVFDTVKVTEYDTLTVTNNVTKYDTVKVTKYDTLTVKNNIYDTVSILKIKFKLTTGVHANQLSSLSIYPNPTSDVLHIEVPDAKALEGYRYRILDALGKEVYNQLVTQSTTEIPLKTLGAVGIYQFEILDATKTSIQSNKIVLQ